MVRFVILTVALLLVPGTSGARGQDADEVKRLKEKVELLEAKLKLAEKEIELLKKEIELLKAGGDKGATKKTAEELIPGNWVRADGKKEYIHEINLRKNGDYSLRNDTAVWEGTYKVLGKSLLLTDSNGPKMELLFSSVDDGELVIWMNIAGDKTKHEWVKFKRSK